MTGNFKHSARLFAQLSIFALGLWSASLSYAENIPVPEKKPQDSSLKNEKNQSERGFSMLDFTASLLDFSGPPIPQRKPQSVPRKPSIVKKLLNKSTKPLSSAPLSRKDSQVYKEIFKAQQGGGIKQADKLLEKIEDPRLLGHVLFQRYMHPTAYKSTFEELRRWLELYYDHPGADRIYKLTGTRKPSGAPSNIKQPQKSRGIARTREPTMRASKRYVSARRRSDEDIRNLNALNRAVYTLVRKGENEQALAKLQAESAILDNVEYDLLRGDIAAGFLYQGHADKAASLAQQSVKRSALHVPKAGWVAGLAAWRKKKYTAAARYFEVVGRSPYASGWTAAAGSYWAARSHMRTGNVKAVSLWLKRGMAQPRTFYGLVSTRALGRDFDFNWKIPAFTKEYLETLSALPAGNRAMALVMAGQPTMAESELIRIRPENDQQHKALLSYAAYANLPGLALRVASAVSSNTEDGFYDAALYPTGAWKPEEGYKIDPALVHAIMRQESRFDPRAKSSSGARGLMQLMPATAKSVADTKNAQLDHPETNLELGQRYLETLLEKSSVDGNLLYLLIAYNAGPGNLAKWKRRWSDVKDPLLFIELIPSSETRAYVERVLSNYWIYRMREDQDTPTLDALAAGKSATYSAKEL